ncbi:MAG: DinB family protein [Gemmatimonadota bacterium]
MTFASIEGQKTEILGLIERWPASRLAYRQSEDAWCALHVIDHLVKVESGVIAEARRGLLSPQRITVRDRLGFFFLDRAFRSRMKVKVPPSATRVLPDLTCSLEVLRERWRDSRTELAQLLARGKPAELELGVFRHPVSGLMNIPQILRFFSAHIHHHGYQIARIAEASERTVEFPSGAT